MVMTEDIIIREAKKEDLKQLWTLCSMYFTDVLNSSFDEFSELWHHRWFGSPFRVADDPLGWVLTDKQDVVKGFIGNISLSIRTGQSLIKAYAATTWVASPEVRTKSMDLFRAFVKYDKSAYLVDATANKVASLVCKRLGLKPVKVNNYQRRLVWIINPFSFMLSKKRFKSVLLKPFAYILGLWLKIYLLIKNHRIYSKGNSYSFSAINRFGPEFDEFWNSIKTQLGIVQERTSAFMNWRHGDLPQLKGQAYPFVCQDHTGKIMGYLVLKSNGIREGGEGKLIITDVLFSPENNDVFIFMVSKAFEFARQRRAETLEFSGFNESLMEQLLNFRPFIRQQGHLTYWFRAPEKIADTSKFWVSAIDGDLNL